MSAIDANATVGLTFVEQPQGDVRDLRRFCEQFIVDASQCGSLVSPTIRMTVEPDGTILVPDPVTKVATSFETYVEDVRALRRWCEELERQNADLLARVEAIEAVVRVKTQLEPA